jgi:thioredoxin reductase (NADPH)
MGGGNSALQEALVLANYCKTVHLVHRRTEFRGERHLVDAVMKRKTDGCSCRRTRLGFFRPSFLAER